MDLKKRFWEDAYQCNIKKMIGVCYRYVANRQTAEDLAHDAFLQAIKKADTFKGKGHFDAWLRRIAVNTALQHLREVKAKNEQQQEIMLLEASNIEEERDMQPNFTIHELLHAVNQLPEHHRLVFNLYVLDNYSHKEIAIELNISEGTSKSHLARARKRLQKVLKEKQQKKEQKQSVLFMLFPCGFGKVDRLFRRKLSNLEIKLQDVLWIDNLMTEQVILPNIRPSAFYATATITAVVIAALTIIVMYNNKESQPSITPEKQNTLVIPVDSMAQPEVLEEITPCVDTVCETKLESSTKPVVVKKKRIIRDTIVVRDTLIILNGNAK